jgi:hypothetical protein
MIIYLKMAQTHLLNKNNDQKDVYISNSDSDDKDKCFVCYGTKHLIKTNICCGVRIVHKHCFNTYIQSNDKQCPICHKNIGDKLKANTTNKCNTTSFYSTIIILIYLTCYITGIILFNKFHRTSVLYNISIALRICTTIISVIVGIFTLDAYRECLV